MNENVIAIVNGGNPIGDCPKNWEDAKAIIVKMNDDKTELEPLWSFDCGFKLDFDGEIVSVNGRFYPPKDYQGKNWDGHLYVCLFGEEIKASYFCCETLEALKNEVEVYVRKLREQVFEQLRKTLIDTIP